MFIHTLLRVGLLSAIAFLIGFIAFKRKIDGEKSCAVSSSCEKCSKKEKCNIVESK